VQYQQGSISGSIYEDNASVSGLGIRSQRFIILNNSHGMDSVLSDGLVGLALPSLSRTGQTVLQNLESQHGITEFGLLLNGLHAEASYLFIGPAKPSWYVPGTLVDVHALGDTWWRFHGALWIGNRTFTGDLMLDSGTSMLGFPAGLYEEAVDILIPDGLRQLCTMSPKTKTHVCPCADARQSMNIEVHIGEGIFVLTPEHLFQGLGEYFSKQCQLSIQPIPEGFPVILGDVFLRSVVAVFDMKNRRIRVAKRVQRRRSWVGQRLWFLWKVILPRFGWSALLMSCSCFFLFRSMREYIHECRSRQEQIQAVEPLLP
jgi:hypothetical protein